MGRRGEGFLVTGDSLKRSTAEFGTKRRHIWREKLMKSSPIAQFLRITRSSSDETGYWMSLHRARKLAWLEHWSSRINMKEHCERRQSWLMESTVWSMALTLHTCIHSKGMTRDNRLTTSMYWEYVPSIIVRWPQTHDIVDAHIIGEEIVYKVGMG